MVFSDLFFIFVFLPAFIILYRLGGLIDRHIGDGQHTHPVRNGVLVVFSLLFYAWGEPVYVLLMLGSVLVNWLAGRWMTSGHTSRKTALVIGIATNIAMLGVFKYAGFVAECLVGLGIPVPVPSVALPIGISFYTFQSISYLVDVYRGAAEVQHRYSGLLLYISMFPQLIAGPIVRYDTVAREINSRKVSAQDVADGSFRFLLGLGKKVILANQFGEICDSLLGAAGMADLSTLGAWVGILAFTLQIYFDFSGYSDMAIGIGRCLGFHFNENFDHPYTCRSITDFWRRWHKSLGSFFRDYVYIPLGGNRTHQFINILVVWMLTGLWHGASWNFVIWGMYFGVLLVIEKFIVLPRSERLPRPVMHLYSMLLVIFGWGIFYFTDLGSMGTFFKALFGGAAELTNLPAETALYSHFWLWPVAILFCLPVRRMMERVPHLVFRPQSNAALNTVVVSRIALSTLLLLLSVALLIGATNNAFLYTRF